MFKVTMPTADHCLATKQAAVDDWEKKLVVNHSALQYIIQVHDNTSTIRVGGRTIQQVTLQHLPVEVLRASLSQVLWEAMVPSIGQQSRHRTP